MVILMDNSTIDYPDIYSRIAEVAIIIFNLLFFCLVIGHLFIYIDYDLRNNCFYKFLRSKLTFLDKFLLSAEKE